MDRQFGRVTYNRTHLEQEWSQGWLHCPMSTPGNVEKALNGIRTARTPSTVSQDFVKTILGITGGSGNQITAYLKKIGFAATDGTPTEIYKQFRNSSTEGKAAAAHFERGTHRFTCATNTCTSLTTNSYVV